MDKTSGVAAVANALAVMALRVQRSREVMEQQEQAREFNRKFEREMSNRSRPVRRNAEHTRMPFILMAGRPDNGGDIGFAGGGGGMGASATQGMPCLQGIEASEDQSMPFARCHRTQVDGGGGGCGESGHGGDAFQNVCGVKTRAEWRDRRRETGGARRGGTGRGGAGRAARPAISRPCRRGGAPATRARRRTDRAQPPAPRLRQRPPAR